MWARAFQRGGMSVHVLPLLKCIHPDFGSWVYFFVYPAATVVSCLAQSQQSSLSYPFNSRYWRLESSWSLSYHICLGNCWPHSSKPSLSLSSYNTLLHTLPKDRLLGKTIFTPDILFHDKGYSLAL